MSKPVPLNVDTIKDGLKTRHIGREVLLYKTTASTNDIAWHYANNPENSGLAVFAEYQKAGRGRGDNKWLSDKKRSILCSILLLDRGVQAELLTITSAVAVAEAISKYSKAAGRIKWPNDVMINGKKVAGILLESRVLGGKKSFVIGVGVNCHQKEDFFAGDEFQMPATSIDVENGPTVDRNALAADLLRTFDDYLAIAEENAEVVTEHWRRLSSQLGHRVTLIYNRKQFSGNCIGIDPAKGLILQLDSGGVSIFDAAHTTILKHN